MCDLSRENVHYGFSVLTQKTVHEPFIICSEKISIRVHGQGQPFRKNFHTCAQVRSSVQKKFPYVRMGKVIHSEKISICAHG